MKELLRCVELLYGMNMLGEPLWVRVGGEAGKGDISVGEKEPIEVPLWTLMAFTLAFTGRGPQQPANSPGAFWRGLVKTTAWDTGLYSS